jgi:hypothetical protein
MRRLGLFIATACVAVLGAAGYASAAAGPVAHWRFDESSGQSAADASGNGNAGTLEAA